jgi:superfamily II DNA or RNA helicase
MFMLNTGDLMKSLKHNFESHIFERGMVYAKSGHIDFFTARVHRHHGEVISITGVVMGSDDYTTHLSIDLVSGAFSQITCTCPYGQGCKHAAALGIVSVNAIDSFIHSLTSTENNMDATVLTSWLTDVGEDEKRIHEISRHALTTPPPQPTVPLKEYMRVVIEQEKINLFLTIPVSIESISLPHQKLTIGNIKRMYTALKGKELDAITILTHFSELESRYNHNWYTPTSNTHLLRTLKESGIQTNLRIGNECTPVIWATGNEHRLEATIDEIIDREKEQQVLVFRAPACLTFNTKLLLDAQGISIINNAHISLHDVTPYIRPFLTDFIRYIVYGGHTHPSYTGPVDEFRIPEQYLVDVPKLIKALSLYFAITMPKTYRTKIVRDAEPSFSLTYNKTERTLLVAPTMKYGESIIDLSDQSALYGRTHDCTINRDVITCIVRNHEKEYELLRYTQRRKRQLGISNRLTCRRRGQAQIRAFVSELLPKYEKAKYPLIYTKDLLTFTERSIDANVSVQKLPEESDENWLAFDYALYCGEATVTLADVIAYLESGAEVMTLHTGEEVTITNKAELKRLVQLLTLAEASLHKGQEGKGRIGMFHTPALDELSKESEHVRAVFDAQVTRFLKKAKTGRLLAKASGTEKISPDVSLREYQETGLTFLQFLHINHFGGILADDMGLGKTLQALMLMVTTQKKKEVSIVIAPKTLLYNWAAEAERFAPELKVSIIDGSSDTRVESIKNAQAYDLLITSYSQLQRDIEHYESEGLTFAHIFLDEAQYIKNPKSKNRASVKRLRGATRIALTGTPIENRLGELWSIFDFALPGLLGSHKTFRSGYELPISTHGDTDVLHSLKRIIAPFMLRRSKSEVLTELPPKIEVVRHCHLEHEQSLLYQDVLARVTNELEVTVAKRGYARSQIDILAALTKLRQICNHPYLLLKDGVYSDYRSAKLDMALELIEEIHNAGQKVIIFSQFVKMLEILREELATRAIPIRYLTGSTKNRQAEIDSFMKDSSVTAFLISLKAGGTGLNLTAAERVIIFDPWWNPSVERQAIDRAHRIGQNKSVEVYRLITLGTIEEKIVALQAKKQGLFDAMITENEAQLGRFTWEDIRALLKPE